MKQIRLKRLLGCDSDHKLIITPLDHGMTMGPISGIDHIRDTLTAISHSPVNAVVLHKGIISSCADLLCQNKNLSIIMHLNASIGFSPNSDKKVMVSSVEEAVMMGADAVSIHINLGNEYDYQMIKDFGAVSGECQKWGMPLLAMICPKYSVPIHVNPENYLDMTKAGEYTSENRCILSPSDVLKF